MGGLYLTGHTAPAHWGGKQQRAGFYTLAREIERLQAWFGIGGEVRELEGDATLDYGLALVKGEKVIARYGALKAEILMDGTSRGCVLRAGGLGSGGAAVPPPQGGI
ncbi:MAG: hypothetical protein U0176_23675 [Bacteroidia bacterium]